MRKLAYLLAYGLAVAATLAAPTSAIAAPENEVPPGLTPSGPVVCGEREDLVIRSRHISTDGNGVEASGKCEVLIVNSYIEARGVGVLAAGTAHIRVRDSFVSGGRGGLVAENRGEIRFSGSTIRGDTQARNLGNIIDEGGNDVAGRVTERPAPLVGIGDLSVESGPEGVRITTGGGTVVVEDDYVRISEGGRVTEISGDWRALGSRYSASDTERLLAELGATVEEGTLQLQMAGDVLFDFDSTAIRPDAAKELAKVAHLIRDRSAGTVSVIGHTDSVGGESYNLKLSEARALGVMRWLNEHESIPAGLMAGQGVGEGKPIAYNTMPDGSDNPEGRARNRRVEIKFEVG